MTGHYIRSTLPTCLRAYPEPRKHRLIGDVFSRNLRVLPSTIRRKCIALRAETCEPSAQWRETAQLPRPVARSAAVPSVTQRRIGLPLPESSPRARRGFRLSEGVPNDASGSKWPHFELHQPRRNAVQPEWLPLRSGVTIVPSPPFMEVAMLSSVRPSRPCRGLVVATTCAALLGATASVAQSTPNGPPICQPGATLQDLEYVLQRYAGYYT